MIKWILCGLLSVLCFSNMVYADTSQECLAVAMLREAGNQPVIGRQAVGLVILNRADADQMDLCRVVKARKQFSWYRGGSIKNYIRKDKRIHVVRLEAMDLMSDPTESKAYRRRDIRTATYFHATYVRPTWASSMCKPTRIKDHIFYTECKSRST